MTDGASFLRSIVAILDACEIPHMLCGSFAARLHGRTRSTDDIDFVVDPTSASLERLLDRLPPDDYYVGATTAREALARRDMFNVIDLHSIWKADLHVRHEDAFSTSAFERRQRSTIYESDVFVMAPEDLVLSKLDWARQGGSDRQVEDAAGVLQMSADLIDDGYLERWAPELGVVELLARARQGSSLS